MIGLAYAMAQPAGNGQPQGSGIGLIIMMAVIFGLFYLLILRPQQKEQKKLQDMLKSIKKGDRVITKGGIYGTVIQEKDQNTLLLKIADNVKIEVMRSAIISVLEKGKEGKD
ncbi:MAG: preprotein translocase subunit YajC [Candidatus Schekmanbacteria bacterium]|nr:MAG: preprotein translocase subunit YajC [Candidatus Schekmanbacteria bacterium]